MYQLVHTVRMVIFLITSVTNFIFVLNYVEAMSNTSVSMNSAPPPPPPPPPLPPPNMVSEENFALTTNISHAAPPVDNDSRTALMEAIRGGTTLKVTSHPHFRTLKFCSPFCLTFQIVNFIARRN